MSTTRNQTEFDGFLDIESFEPPEFSLARLNSQIREMMNVALRPFGLKLVEWRILQCLHEGERLFTVAELAEFTVIDRTVASRLIDKMVSRGLVTKTALKQDRRFMTIKICEDGTTLFRRSLKATRKARKHLFDGLGETDVEELLRILSVMQSNAESRRKRY